MCMCPESHVTFEYFPIGINASPIVQCALCKNLKHATEVTIGGVDREGSQAFACSNHLISSYEWILGWTDFIVNGDTSNAPYKQGDRFLESRKTVSAVTKMADIALHIPFRHRSKIIVLINDPHRYLSVLRKYWIKLLRNIEREKARTLEIKRKSFLEKLSVELSNLRITAGKIDDGKQYGVYLLDPIQQDILPDGVGTIFVCDWPSGDHCRKLFSNTSESAAIIEYLD